MRSRSASSSLVALTRARPVSRLVEAFADRRRFQLHGVPFVAQGLHQHRLDDEQDVLARGVMGAELSALGRVEAALKEGAEYRRLDRFPVELRRFGQGVNGFQRQVFDRDHVKERAIEVFDVFAEEFAAAIHLVEQSCADAA